MLRRYPKTVAVLLLLGFTQIAGLRLWMHDWFHESKAAQSKSPPGSDNLQLKGDCLDDGMMLLLESPIIIVALPVRQYATLTAARHCPILSAEKICYSLKGRPHRPIEYSLSPLLIRCRTDLPGQITLAWLPNQT